MAFVEEYATLWGPMPPHFCTRAAVGAVALPVDDATVARFFAKCAPVDDHGHRWWLGAIDDGGYSRFQAGSGVATLVTTTAHRFADTLARGPIPPGIVARHRCDEPLCTADEHLERGTVADNSWDMVARPDRAADRDERGCAGRSRAIRAAILGVLARGVTNSAAIGAAARAAMLRGDPYRHQLTLWPLPDIAGVTSPRLAR